MDKKELPPKRRIISATPSAMAGQSRRVVVAGLPVSQVTARKTISTFCVEGVSKTPTPKSPQLGDVFGGALSAVRAECKDAFQVATDSAKEFLNKIRLCAFDQEVTEMIEKFYEQIDLLIANDPQCRNEKLLLDFLETKHSEIQYLSVLYFTTVTFAPDEIQMEPQGKRGGLSGACTREVVTILTDACVSTKRKGFDWIRSKRIEAIYIRRKSQFPEPNKPLETISSSVTPKLPKIIYPENECFGSEWFIQFQDDSHVGDLPLPDGTNVQVMGEDMWATMRRHNNQWVYWPFDVDANLVPVPLYGKTSEGFVDKDPTMFEPEADVIARYTAVVTMYFECKTKQSGTAYQPLSD